MSIVNSIKVIKRDKREVPYDASKIETAVMKAAIQRRKTRSLTVEDQQIARSIAKQVSDQLNESLKDQIDIEEIQDMVVEYLESADIELSSLYREYRQQRTRNREANSEYMKFAMGIIKKGDSSNQNGNVDGFSFGGRAGAICDHIMTRIAMEKLVSPTTRFNHENNISYIHDRSHYALGDPNCIFAKLDYILANGMECKQTDIRPAQSISTACQIAVVYFQLHSLVQFGGIAASHFDHTMVPYIRRSFMKHYIVAWTFSHPEFFEGTSMLELDSEYTEIRLASGLHIIRTKFDDFLDEKKELFFEETGLTLEDFRFDNKSALDPILYEQAMYNTIKETKQAVEGLMHNLNSLQSRSGNQLKWRLAA